MGNFIKLINGEKAVLADFYATWCSPCKTMAPILKETKSKLEDQITIVKIDVDKNEKAATRFAIRGVPTLILFKEGKIIWRKSGVLNSTELINEIKGFLN